MKKLAIGLPGGYNVSHPSGFKFAGGTISDIINALIPYVFGIVGFLLILFLVWGGFDWMTSGGNQEKIQKAKAKISGALIGFLIIFASYWVIQILEIIFGLQILT